jgi:hypothetical protein
MTSRTELLSALKRAGLPHAELRSGTGWLVMVPGLAARILGAGIGEENALWVAPEFSERGWANGGNAGGQRTWLAPELGPGGFFGPDVGHWRVPPELDPGAYAPVPATEGWHAWRTRLLARAADGKQYPVAVTREVRIDDPQSAAPIPVLRIRFRHAVENIGATPIDKRVGLWCIAQVPSDHAAAILIPLRGGIRSDGIRPYFEELPPGALRITRGLAYLRAQGGTRYKVGAPPAVAAGGIAFIGRSRLGPGRVLVCLQFPVDPTGAPGPGDAVQAYNDPGLGALAFSEIEAHAPAMALGPGERQEFEIVMTVAVGADELIRKTTRRELGAEVMIGNL